MKKFGVEFMLSAFVFLAVYWGLSRIDWLKAFSISPNFIEIKLSEWSDEYLENTIFDKFENEIVSTTMDSIKVRMCWPNGIDPDEIRIMVVHDPEVNAYAYLGDRIIVNTGLLREVHNEAELAGVLGHELAHIQCHHVMKKLTAELGAHILLTLISGSSEVVGQIAKILSSTAYSRSQESEADRIGMNYLLKSGINVMPTADLFERLSEKEHTSINLQWINTHPDLKERVRQIRRMGKGQKNLCSILDERQWKMMKRAVE